MDQTPGSIPRRPWLIRKIFNALAELGATGTVWAKWGVDVQISTQGKANLMTYVEHHTANTRVVPNRPYLANIHSYAAALQKFLGGAHSACSSIFAYLAHSHGPTLSASALLYGGVAAAGTVLYESLNDASADGVPASGVFCERGCLRRLTNDLHLKASDELRLHQTVLGQSFGYRYVNDPLQRNFLRIGI